MGIVEVPKLRRKRLRFIDDLARESLQGATHDWASRNRGTLGRGPAPVLSDSVHSLLASWAVAFFFPRGIRVYAAQDGRRVVPPPVEPLGRSARGTLRHDEWSSDGEGYTEDEYDEDETGARREEIYLPRRERELRRGERQRSRRRERRSREQEGLRRGRGGEAEWEVHFVYARPTLWTPGARPRTYGEPKVRLRR